MFCLRQVNIVKMSILLKLIYRVNEIPTEQDFLIELDPTWKGKGPQIAKTLLKKNEIGGLVF